MHHVLSFSAPFYTFTQMSNLRRNTRGALQASNCCYDKFCLGLITKEADLCRGCFAFNEIHVKKKPQTEMGRQFQCLLPTAGAELPAAELEVIRRKVTSVAYSSIEDSSAVARRSDNEVTQPRETKASQEKKLVQLGNKLAHSEQKLVESQTKRKELQIEHFNCSQQHAREKQIMLEKNIRLSEEKNNLQETINNLQLELVAMQVAIDNAEGTASRASTNERKSFAKLSNLRRCQGMDCDPFQSSLSLLKNLSSNGSSDEDSVNGMFAANKKKTRQHIVNAVLESAVGNDVKKHVEVKFYKSLQEKFAPWKCLLHLDLEASVSFRGLNVIRKIEFYGEEKQKYRRGIINERTKLTRVAQELESYGRRFLPYELTKTSVQFNIEIATKYLLKKFKLWGHVKSKENVLIAATVDGGQLAWKITQISAGIKIVEERSINP